MRFFAIVVLYTVFSFSSIMEAQAERRIALVIGNGAYSSQPLANPANDAALMAETLRGVGFEVMEVIDADARGMRKAVHTFSRTLGRAGDDAVGFVFYAGHGIQAKGENYLIPVDAQIEEAIDVEFEGFPASTLLSALENAGNRLNIVVMDACRNNPYKAATRSGGAGLARMDAPSGTLIAYSTAPGKVAADGRGRNSPYTRALSRAIASPGAKVEDVFKTVRVAVMDRTNEAQVPWESSSLTGDFFFVEKQPEPVATPEPPVPAAPDNTVELTFWNSIKDSTDASLFEAYLAQYPEGLFAALAKAKIGVIQKQANTARSQTETAFFQAIQNSEDPADFQAYLDQYPNGAFASLATARIAFLEERREQASRSTAAQAAAEQAAAAQTDADRQAWEQAGKVNTADAFNAYLERFPGGQYVDLARARIAGIEETQQVAALTPAPPGHPMDGKWRIVWKNVRSGVLPMYAFCSNGETGEAVVEVQEGKFKTRISSSLNRIGTIRGSFSEAGAIRGTFVGAQWPSGSATFRGTVENGEGSTKAEHCGIQEFSFTKLEP